MSEQTNKSTISKRKQSIIAGGLISSAGIFFSKFIGLFYAVPYYSILGNDNGNIAYYGVAFVIYSYLLNICTAGFPFAIATLVAKYTSKGDYQTTLLIKKLSTIVMIFLGFVAMLSVMLFSEPLAKLVLPEDGNDIEVMRTVLILISLALFFVPFLSSIRGFYQGLKHMEMYALSQVLEQIVRVVFLLVFSAIAVYVFQGDRVWGVYFGVLSTSIAAILAYIHFKFYDRKRMPELRRLAKTQSVAPASNRNEIIHELIFIALPFLVVAVLGYSDTLVNTMFLNKGLTAFGNTASEITLITGEINFSILKLMSIPTILAPGFSSAIIPHITTALTQGNIRLVRKNIRDCIDIVLYLGVPICFCLFAFAKPIYAVMFDPGDNLELCSQILSWFSIEAFFNTIAPVFTSILLVVGLRRAIIRNLILMAILKLGTSYFLLAQFGYPGIVFSTILAMGTLTLLNMYELTKHYQVSWRYTMNKLMLICVGLAAIFLVAQLCSLIGLKGYTAGRFMNMIQLGISGLLAMSAYFAVTYAFQIPQTILHLDLSKIVGKLKRK